MVEFICYYIKIISALIVIKIILLFSSKQNNRFISMYNETYNKFNDT